MAKTSLVKGTTSYLARIFIQNSSLTTGAGLTGLAFNTAGLTCYRARDDDGNAGGTAISLVTATLGTWASGGFKEKDATNMPGWYEFGVTNAGLASGSKTVSIHFQGATNMAPCVLEFELTATDNQDGVHGGMTALPNTACTTNASLLTSGSGTDQLSVSSGRAKADTVYWNAAAVATPTNAGYPLIDIHSGTGTNQLSVSSGQVILQTGTGTGQLDFTSGVVKANATQWLGGTIPSVNVTGVPLVDAKYLLGTVFPTPTVAGVPNVNTKTINDVATTSITTINANVGTTQPTNFTGTGASALVKGDAIDWNSVAVTGMPMPTYTQPTGFLAATFPSGTIANTTNITAGTITTVTTVTNQLTAAQIATGIWQDTTAGDFTIALSIGKSIMNGVSLGTGLTINAYTGNTPQTGDNYPRIGAAGAGLTSLGDARIANLDTTVSSRLATSGYTAPDNANIGVAATQATTAATNTASLITTLATLAAKFTGITLLAQWLGAMAGKQTANSTARTEIRATGAGSGTFDETEDSLEASHDAGVTVGGYASGQDPATLVLDAAAAAHNTAGSIGQKINAAGAAADPLTNQVPGSYAQGTGGYVLGHLDTANITVISPVAQSGNLTLNQGDDYLLADNRSLLFTGASANIWPSLSGATIAFTTDGTNPCTGTGTAIAATGTQQFRIELTAAQTSKLRQGTSAGNFDIVATLSNGHVVTLVSGKYYVPVV